MEIRFAGNSMGFRKRKFREKEYCRWKKGGNTKMHDNTHLMLEERKVIEVGYNGLEN